MVAVGMKAGSNIVCLYQGIKQRHTPFAAAITFSSAACDGATSKAAHAARDNVMYVTTPLMCVAADDDPVSPHSLESLLGVAAVDVSYRPHHIITVSTQRGGCMGWMERDTGLWWTKLCVTYIAHVFALSTSSSK
jgi:predicted alpha/beta-fold hydrolase